MLAVKIHTRVEREDREQLALQRASHSYARTGQELIFEEGEGYAGEMTYQHFSASMSFPGVSRHLRINAVCWRTAMRASSSRRAWSSGGAGADILELMRSSMRCYAAASERMKGALEMLQFKPSPTPSGQCDSISGIERGDSHLDQVVCSSWLR